ncbi:helix-turn-helix domain-containing protein [Shouchella miscanthi]|uniref:helix-turn-helix domain-containing protein n=1 Tax=Shouchella miscanthi TaxID=2598861 RepID=UPI0011A64A2A|nr:helix-turn-helix transcriptional regulator [Shouchella miscanthi]
MHRKQLVVKHRLRELMHVHNIPSVQELSGRTGIYYATLLNFYNNKFNTFNNRIFATLCEFFKCEIDDLIYLDEDGGTWTSYLLQMRS